MNNPISTLLFLAGGGGEDDSSKIDTQFIKLLKHKKIIYLPLALEPSIDGYEGCYDWISSTLSSRSTGEFVDIVMWTDLSNKKVIDLKQYDAIYIGGGNTYKLLENIKETNFDKVLINFYKNGGIIYGGSAGAIICGHDIKTVSEENKNNYHCSNSLNLIGNNSLICHYQPMLNNKIIEYIKKNKRQVIAIPERSGLIVKDSNNFYVIGYEPVYLFGIDGSTKTINIDQNFII